MRALGGRSPAPAGRARCQLTERTAPRVPADRAAHLIWALASPDVGRMLYGVQGWATAEYAAWLGETLATTLLTAE